MNSNNIIQFPHSRPRAAMRETRSVKHTPPVFKAIISWEQGLDRAPVIYPIGGRDIEHEAIFQRIVAALKGGR